VIGQDHLSGRFKLEKKQKEKEREKEHISVRANAT
jgi:hypothetical protein